MNNDEDWEVYRVSNMELGEEIGLKKGLKKGREEGRDDERVRIVRRMLEKGRDIHAIMDELDLPESEMDWILAMIKAQDKNRRDIFEDVTERSPKKQ